MWFALVDYANNDDRLSVSLAAIIVQSTANVSSGVIVDWSSRSEFYHLLMRIGNNFSQVCLSVCLSASLFVCLSVCSGRTFELLIVGTSFSVYKYILTMSRYTYEGHWMKVKVKCIFCHICLVFNSISLYFTQRCSQRSRSSEGQGQCH